MNSNIEEINSCNNGDTNEVFSWDGISLLWPEESSQTSSQKNEFFDCTVETHIQQNEDLDYKNEKKSGTEKKQTKKQIKSTNLRVCFASISEKLSNLDQHWDKVEKMVLSYEKGLAEASRGLSACKKHVDSMEEETA